MGDSAGTSALLLLLATKPKPTPHQWARQQLAREQVVVVVIVEDSMTHSTSGGVGGRWHHGGVGSWSKSWWWRWTTRWRRPHRFLLRVDLLHDGDAALRPEALGDAGALVQDPEAEEGDARALHSARVRKRPRRPGRLRSRLGLVGVLAHDHVALLTWQSRADAPAPRRCRCSGAARRARQSSKAPSSSGSVFPSKR